MRQRASLGLSCTCLEMRTLNSDLLGVGDDMGGGCHVVRRWDDPGLVLRGIASVSNGSTLPPEASDSITAILKECVFPQPNGV